LTIAVVVQRTAACVLEVTTNEGFARGSGCAADRVDGVAQESVAVDVQSVLGERPEVRFDDGRVAGTAATRAGPALEHAQFDRFATGLRRVPNKRRNSTVVERSLEVRRGEWGSRWRRRFERVQTTTNDRAPAVVALSFQRVAQGVAGQRSETEGVIRNRKVELRFRPVRLKL